MGTSSDPSCDDRSHRDPDATGSVTPVPLVRAYLGLGANVGDAPATLAWAVRRLASEPGVRVRGVSRLYTTRPVGVADQPNFHNAALALDVRFDADAVTAALALVGRLKALEREAG